MVFPRAEWPRVLVGRFGIVGAFMHLPLAESFKSTCSYCGVGCGIDILRHADGQLELRGDPSHPANRGMLCSKGRSLLHTVRATAPRLHFPAIRSGRGACPERVSWAAAMAHVAAAFRRIVQTHGPDAVAFYISGQCLTEEYYLANKIVKGFLGTNNIDTNSRLCMSSAVAGYKATLGADAPPTCYEDIEQADTFLIAGANPAWCHPILFRRIEARKEAAPDTAVIVVDPRRTATASSANLHLQLRPGTDVPLFLGMARRLAQTGQADHAFLAQHTEGADAFLESAEPWTLARTAETTGVAEADVARAADLLGGDRRFLSMWTMGLNQSAVGTNKNIALISLSLLTGKIGKPGCGPFSLTGQPNAMGGREVGGMANLLPAHRDLANPTHRAEVARFWNVPTLPEKPGLTAVELFDAIDAGKVKAVWIIATNPAASLPAAWNVERALAKAELVVAQDIYPTETTDLAHVVLPAAGWLEKTGTMTSADRRLSLLEQAVKPPGEALPDAEILLRFAHEMGWRSHFPYTTAAEIFAEHAALTAGTDIDITALSHDVLKSHGPTQWPAPGRREIGQPEQAPGGPRLYTTHVFPTPTGRARLHPLVFENRSEPLSPEFPLVLTTGRIRDHWHYMTKTGQVNRLSAHISAPFCEIHPDDAAARQIRDGDILTVRSARGEVRVAARVTADIRPGVLFLPMHFGKTLAGRQGGEDRRRTNNVTSPRLDPVSKEPDLKFAAVQAEKFTPGKRRIAIIGAGAAALAFVEHHRPHNPRDDIVIFGAEDLPLYNRVMLPHYIEQGGGPAPWESLIRADAGSLLPHRVIFHRNTLVYRIDREQRTLHDFRGRASCYDLLILATGSRPALQYDGPLPASGSHTLRSRNDADAILAAAAPGKNVIIQGAGLLGLELADALNRRGCRVTILQRSDRLMGRQLDAVASACLARELANRRIDIRFNTTLVEAVGEQRLKGVRVQTRSEASSELSAIPADLLIFATGIVPNKELAGAALLDCNRGVLVNEHLQTSDPAIYAIGECAEFQGHTFGTTSAATEQARALAEHLRGNDHAPYKPTTTANILKLHGFQLAAAGETDPDPLDESAEVVTLYDARKRYYQKCVLRNDRLVGVICVGDTRRFSQYLDWISTGMELDGLRETLLRPAAGASDSQGPIVCSCHGVGAETIREAAAVHQCDLAKVCSATKAGTGCGSCKPEIVELLKAAAVRLV
ncbi:MAG TPA: molybdopterin-dependent oxidoreductase [Phycisphaerae bacterium]|nr:molybdopterin-dependent oxidoreductase [Phycisphaerae bacterium]